LEQQIHDKQAREAAEKERDLELGTVCKSLSRELVCTFLICSIVCFAANEMNSYARELSRLESLRANAKRRMNKEFSAYRQTMQPKESRREWDLNDPQQLRKVESLRTEQRGEPPKLGASSIQVFQGEDEDYQNRKKYQQAQVSYWREEKAAEVAAQKKAEEDAEREYAELMKQMAELSLAHEEAKAAILKRHGRLVGQDNQQLVARKHTRLQQEAQRDAEEAARDLETHTQSALLNEVEPPSQFGAHRIVPYAYKGMTSDKKQAIFDEVAHQLQEKQAIQQAEKQREAALAAEAETYRKLSLLKEREAQRAAHSKRLQVQQDILKQNAEKRAQYVFSCQVIPLICVSNIDSRFLTVQFGEFVS
jgi:hypothetical protein